MGPLHKTGHAAGEVEVECYSGYKGEERPLRFRRGGDCFEVEEILERWYEPGKSCFVVRARGAAYLLWREEEAGVWKLQPRCGSEGRGAGK